MDDISRLTPGQLAGIVKKVYGSRLTFQQSLLFYVLVRSEGLVTYDQIENYLWSDDHFPEWPRKAIHVLVSHLRVKVPTFVAVAHDGQGYRCTVDLHDVYSGPTP